MKTHCPYCQKPARLYDKITENHKQFLYYQCHNIRQCGARTQHRLSIKKALSHSLLKKAPHHNHIKLSDDNRVLCPCCDENLTLQTRYNITAGISDIYANCENPACQARFVLNLSYDTTVLPPINHVEQMAAQIVKSAPKGVFDDRQLGLFAFAGD